MVLYYFINVEDGRWIRIFQGSYTYCMDIDSLDHRHPDLMQLAVF